MVSSDRTKRGVPFTFAAWNVQFISCYLCLGKKPVEIDCICGTPQTDTEEDSELMTCRRA